MMCLIHKMIYVGIVEPQWESSRDVEGFATRVGWV